MEEILEMPDGITYVSTLSGGLDSALVTYLTMKLRPNSKMVLSTICLEHMNNYNFDNVKNIMNYLDYAFPYRILDHRIVILLTEMLPVKAEVNKHVNWCCNIKHKD